MTTCTSIGISVSANVLLVTSVTQTRTSAFPATKTATLVRIPRLRVPAAILGLPIPSYSTMLAWNRVPLTSLYSMRANVSSAIAPVKRAPISPGNAQLANHTWDLTLLVSVAPRCASLKRRFMSQRRKLANTVMKTVQNALGQSINALNVKKDSFLIQTLPAGLNAVKPIKLQSTAFVRSVKSPVRLVSARQTIAQHASTLSNFILDKTVSNIAHPSMNFLLLTIWFASTLDLFVPTVLKWMRMAMAVSPFNSSAKKGTKSMMPGRLACHHLGPQFPSPSFYWLCLYPSWYLDRTLRRNSSSKFLLIWFHWLVLSKWSCTYSWLLTH